MMKTKSLLTLVAGLLTASFAHAFCGFYVAKADAKLFNKTSQVILVRDGNRTTVTMSSDFEGDVKDFAMVVPIPKVPGEKDIRTVHQNIFDILDAYSAPRLAEYYDENPCYVYAKYKSMKSEGMVMRSMAFDEMEVAEDKVVIEAAYEVDEYDVLILSSEESDALESWLIKNGYKMPKGASQVLHPYIKSGMKFFVVKVNLDRLAAKGTTALTPLQMTFTTDKFMLPIRLGMANANGDQDMIVYAITRGGRVECTNYRTTKIPTNQEIPLFVQNDFGNFYKDVFDRHVVREGKRNVFLEYAWDVSPQNFVKCDPCVGNPPAKHDLEQAGVFWFSNNAYDNHNKAFFTRLHVRYNLQDFPQDLFFQVTPNTENFQGRYVIRHPATGDLSCDDAQAYLKNLVKRRQTELHTLANLTGNEVGQHDDYVRKYAEKIKGQNEKQNSLYPVTTPNNNTPTIGPKKLFYVSIAVIFMLVVLLPWARSYRAKLNA